ncbi:tetratricopeptide repeat protein [Paraburkholderia sediminicola]|uniref:tetratricopeptide repeat protein n=1 Tax=Paraburkholderia sediminicola TaxID=458836 RepID=UPI0038BA021B
MKSLLMPASARRFTFGDARHASLFILATLVVPVLLVASGCSMLSPATQVHTRPATLNGVAASGNSSGNGGGSAKLDDMTLASSALQSGDLSLASTMFGKVLETQPDNLDALTGMGATLVLTGELERARGMYERAAARNPERIAPVLGLARIAVRQRRLDEAIALYQRVLSHEPSNPLASAGLGTAYALKGDTARAQLIYSDALRQHPGDAMLTIDLGLSMVLDGNVRKGANLLLSVAAEPGTPPQGRQNLALAYGLLGNNTAADKILMRDLPRGSTDDNLAFYKLVRSRLDSAPPTQTQAPAQAASQALALSQMQARPRPQSQAAIPLPPVLPAVPALQPDRGVASSLAAVQPARVPAIQHWDMLRQTPLLGAR